MKRFPLIIAVAIFALPQFSFAARSFQAELSASQVVANPTTTTGTGFATFALSDDGSQLEYFLALDGLNLEADMAARVNPNDVDKIHLHFAPIGSPGPHVLNIFGLPSEDDAQLSVDYDQNTLSGVWDDGDAINPTTGELFDPTVGGTTKKLSDFADEFENGNIYIAVHTAGEGGKVAIRGQAVPEPGSLAVFGGLFMVGFLFRLWRQRQHNGPLA